MAIGLAEAITDETEQAIMNSEKSFMMILDMFGSLKDSMKNAVEHLNNLSENEKVSRQTFENNEYKYKDGEAPDMENMEEVELKINSEYEKVFIEKLDKYDLKYNTFKLDDDTTRVVILGSSKENIEKAMKEYIFEIDKISEKKKEKGKRPYEEVKKDAETKKQDLDKENKDKELSKNKKREVNMEI